MVSRLGIGSSADARTRHPGVTVGPWGEIPVVSADDI
jgi:hypothetical protein